MSKHDEAYFKAQKNYLNAINLKDEDKARKKMLELEDLVIDDFYDELKSLGLYQGFMAVMYRMKDRGVI